MLILTQPGMPTTKDDSQKFVTYTATFAFSYFIETVFIWNFWNQFQEPVLHIKTEKKLKKHVFGNKWFLI